MGLLSRLTVINLTGCSSLLELPESIGDLDSLTELDLCGCSALLTLPESTGECTSLTWLDLNRCSSLQVWFKDRVTMIMMMMFQFRLTTPLMIRVFLAKCVGQSIVLYEALQIPVQPDG